MTTWSRARSALLPAVVVLMTVVTGALPAGAGTTPATPAAPAPVLTLEVGSVRVGGAVTASVSAAPAEVERRVVLDQLRPDGWRTVGRTTLEAGAAEAWLRVPTDHYSAYSYRARVAETVSQPATLTVLPRYTPRGAALDWTTYYARSLQHSEVFMRWNPCAAPIRYTVNDARAQRGALADVRGALRRIRAATGLRFVYVGPTRTVPNGRADQRYGRGARLLVAWARPEQTPLLKGGVFGRAVPFYTRGFEGADGRRTARIDRAAVVIDSTAQRYYHHGFARVPSRGTLLAHELTHALGLGHAERRTQLMYPALNAASPRFGAGDLSGLAAVGGQQGCLTRP